MHLSDQDRIIINFSRQRIARGLFGMFVLALSGAFVAIAPWATDIQMAPPSYGWLFQIAGLVVAAVAMIPVVHERFGGSRAQRDLVEYAMALCLIKTGRAEEAARLLLTRRPVTTSIRDLRAF